MKLPMIAIDGPAGAGKSSTSKEVARRLGLPYLDSGALYRSVAWAVNRRSLDPKNIPAITTLTDKLNIKFTEDSGTTRVWIDDAEITDELRAPQITRTASVVCMIREVREKVSDLLTKWTGRKFGVIEGRDIGTVIVPGAGLKIFMTARPEIRALRRGKDLGIAENSEALAKLALEIKERDLRDSKRGESPLRKAEDAILIDTSEMTFDEQVSKIVGFAAEKFDLKQYGVYTGT